MFIKNIQVLSKNLLLSIFQHINEKHRCCRDSKNNGPSCRVLKMFRFRLPNPPKPPSPGTDGAPWPNDGPPAKGLGFWIPAAPGKLFNNPGPAPICWPLANAPMSPRFPLPTGLFNELAKSALGDALNGGDKPWVSGIWPKPLNGGVWKKKKMFEVFK